MPITTVIPARAPKIYQVAVEGKLDASWKDWLGGMEIVCRKESDGSMITMLSGEIADQAALRGLLNRLWDLNLSLRSVVRIDPTPTTHKE